MWICIIVWNTLFQPEYKAPFFLFISDLDSNQDSNPDPKSGSETGSETGSEMFISVPVRIRIRPKVSDLYGSGSGSGSATLLTCPTLCIRLPPWGRLNIWRVEAIPAVGRVRKVERVPNNNILCWSPRILARGQGPPCYNSLSSDSHKALYLVPVLWYLWHMTRCPRA